MILDTACGDLMVKSVWRGGVTSSTSDSVMSPALCQQMLKVLGRDDDLRRTYVRLRWQGLVEEIEIASPLGPDNARRR